MPYIQCLGNRSEKTSEVAGEVLLAAGRGTSFFWGYQFPCKLQVAKKQGHHRPSHPTSPNLPTVPQLPSSPFVCNEDHQNGKHVAFDGSTTFNEFHVFSYISANGSFPLQPKENIKKRHLKNHPKKLTRHSKNHPPRINHQKVHPIHPFTIHQSVIIILPTQNLCTLKGTLKNHHAYHHSLIISPKIGDVINSIIPYRSHP